MLAAVAFAALLQISPAPVHHLPDTSPLNDPMRPVSQITRDGFTLQYYTSQPCPTRIQLRQGHIPMVAFGIKQKLTWKEISGNGNSTLHTLTVAGLEPGKRYFYRIYDPGVKPTSEEQNWGAGDGYRREYAVSTLAPKGRKTIIHLPVKVLLMPNVINVVSAYGERSNPAPEPPKMSPEQIQMIKDEFAVSARFFWVNSGMRLWVDYQFYVDDRWQRWGPEPQGATGLYKDLPLNRNYGGKDYTDPGGGVHTIVDTKDITKIGSDPIVEEQPYSGQIEMAWPRRWNRNAGKWEFYNSGGGTFGVDQFPQGFPGRSQFLGGGDTAWLATHEFHHDLESHGQFSLSYREDERIVFNHYAARHRVVKGDGTADELTWATSGRHGEHWDGMAFWDRTLTDAQWLRFYFGLTETVKDADGDGFPDDAPRLPLDEKRFGSNPSRASTDGALSDLEKAMFSTWVPAPLQASWIKPPFQGVIPDPKKKDQDGDGIDDALDPYPLYPYQPFIVPMHAAIDGDPAEWKDVPLGGMIDKGGMHMEFKQSHDEIGYCGLLTVRGPWRKIDANFDGEGLGIYSGAGVQGFSVLNLKASGAVAAGPEVGVVDVDTRIWKAPGLKWKAKRQGDTTFFEFSFPNRGAGIWYWNRGGREIGSVVNLWDTQNRGYSMYEPYRIFYARMLETVGKESMPSNPPAEVGDEPGVTVYKPGDPKIKIEGDWTLKDGALTYAGQEEKSLSIEVPKIKEFDLLAIVEANSDGIIGAFTSAKVTSVTDYIGFIGGYANRVSRMRFFGQEVGDEPVVMTPGKHRIQLTRREGQLWLLFDGKPIIWGVDPNPNATISRLAVLGGYGGGQKVYEIRVKA